MAACVLSAHVMITQIAPHVIGWADSQTNERTREKLLTSHTPTSMTCYRTSLSSVTQFTTSAFVNLRYFFSCSFSYR